MSHRSHRILSIIGIIVAFLWTVTGWGQNPPATPPDPHQTEIAKLLDKAVSSNDAEEQIKLYREILQIDPNNANAFAGLKDAQQKADQQKKDLEQKGTQKKQDEMKAASDQQARRTASEDVDRAVAAGDLQSAQTSLETLRKYGASSPELQRAESLVHGMGDYRRRVKMAVIACVVIVLGVFLAFALSFLRRREPYLEVVEGTDQGQRFALAKEITLIGSVADYGDGKNDIVLSDEERMISRCQCEIHKRDGKLYLLDCNSSNGTFLNGQRLEPEMPIVLRRGSRIDLAGASALRLGFERRKG